jgi:hypothetical protein
VFTSVRHARQYSKPKQDAYSQQCPCQRRGYNARERLVVISMPKEIAGPLPPIPDTVSVSRTHEDAVLYSCQQGHASEAEKKRSHCIVQTL